MEDLFIVYWTLIIYVLYAHAPAMTEVRTHFRSEEKCAAAGQQWVDSSAVWGRTFKFACLQIDER